MVNTTFLIQQLSKRVRMFMTLSARVAFDDTSTGPAEPSGPETGSTWLDSRRADCGQASPASRPPARVKALMVAGGRAVGAGGLRVTFRSFSTKKRPERSLRVSALPFCRSALNLSILLFLSMLPQQIFVISPEAAATGR